MDGKVADAIRIGQWIGSSGKAEGKDGVIQPPFYYILLKAALYLNVPVWELAERPDKAAWISLAMTCMNGEAKGRETLEQIEKAKGR